MEEIVYKYYLVHLSFLMWELLSFNLTSKHVIKLTYYTILYTRHITSFVIVYYIVE